MRILLIEDEVHLSEALVQILNNNGFSADNVTDGESGLNCALSGMYDLILLDIMLPKVNGLDILKKLRKTDRETPVILLTARNDVSDRIQGLDFGADDYLPKPFNTDELLARIRALIRRNGGNPPCEAIIYADVALSKLYLKLSTDTSSVMLTQREFELFEYIFYNHTIVIPPEKIAIRLNPENPAISEDEVDRYIVILQKKLMHIKSSLRILTIKGVGYKLVFPEESDLWSDGYDVENI